MLAFLDLRPPRSASAAIRSIRWAYEDGRSEADLIRSALEYPALDREARAFHRLNREKIIVQGAPHRIVANRMVEVLSGHALVASAPSWSGK
jgi:hypothetical protein